MRISDWSSDVCSSDLLIADVRDPDALTQGVDLALERTGRLDTVVAAAAVITGGTPLWKSDPAAMELMWDINVRGVWNTAAATVPALLSNPDPSGCRFVAIASTAGHHGPFTHTANNPPTHPLHGTP